MTLDVVVAVVVHVVVAVVFDFDFVFVVVLSSSSCQCHDDDGDGGWVANFGVEIATFLVVMSVVVPTCTIVTIGLTNWLPFDFFLPLAVATLERHLGWHVIIIDKPVFVHYEMDPYQMQMLYRT